MRSLVINADDLGLAPGVNRGIFEAHAAGTVSSASIMVSCPAFGEAAEQALRDAPALGVGLHVNLVSGTPLTAVPSLVDPETGRFHPLDVLARHALAGQVEAADVRRECEAQLAALVAAGITPTHLDSHRHAHALPGILPAVAAVAEDESIPVVRRPLDRASLLDPIASAKMLVLHAAWRTALIGVAVAHRARLARAPHFRGIAMQGMPDVRERLLATLDQLPLGVTEIMMHPGYDDEVLAAQDGYLVEREAELKALLDPAVRARLDKGDLRLVSFRELA
ncbi:MAG TPA: ChbG/HpnK family deacetylase [Gemmatimonadaceae bacterium]|nr:ChbG/HpnK family deacetylase [Gemmatimonadaceae bacterium]